MSPWIEPTQRPRYLRQLRPTCPEGQRAGPKARGVRALLGWQPFAGVIWLIPYLKNYTIRSLIFTGSAKAMLPKMQIPAASC